MIAFKYQSQVPLLEFLFPIVCEDIIHWILLFPFHESMAIASFLFACGHFLFVSPRHWLSKICMIKFVLMLGMGWLYAGIFTRCGFIVQSGQHILFDCFLRWIERETLNDEDRIKIRLGLGRTIGKEKTDYEPHPEMLKLANFVSQMQNEEFKKYSWKIDSVD